MSSKCIQECVHGFWIYLESKQSEVQTTESSLKLTSKADSEPSSVVSILFIRMTLRQAEQYTQLLTNKAFTKFLPSYFFISQNHWIECYSMHLHWSLGMNQNVIKSYSSCVGKYCKCLKLQAKQEWKHTLDLFRKAKIFVCQHSAHY